MNRRSFFKLTLKAAAAAAAAPLISETVSVFAWEEYGMGFEVGRPHIVGGITPASFIFWRNQQAVVECWEQYVRQLPY